MKSICNLTLAVLSDIHGNLHALNTVLDDIKKTEKVDGYLILGDLVVGGPEPIGVLNRLSDLEYTQFVLGNSDRYIATGEYPGPKKCEIDSSPELIKTYTEIRNSYNWTRNLINDNGWLDWIQSLPLDYRCIIGDGTRVLCVHSEPGLDCGDGLNPTMKRSIIQSKLKMSNADLILVGHTHCSIDLIFESVRLVNPGSVGMPLKTDLRASYSIMYANQESYRIDHRKVDYDRKKVIEKAIINCYPNVDYIKRNMEKGMKPQWMQ